MPTPIENTESAAQPRSSALRKSRGFSRSETDTDLLLAC